ncbi:response regulator [Indioceanicola profundi]|uniref:response regulator n=1 Tax=Indioceanicola profundi TaxID=2220096 RepID=UPI0013C52076|nr:response regulator [Indioceanicola profundi]
MDGDDLDSLFLTEDQEGIAPDQPAAQDAPPWPILVVDDDEEVRIMTRLVLGRLRYKNRPLELLMARSALEAEELLRRRDDIAVALVDIVMETDDAGLRLARRIREDFANQDMRIVLRTGQPGQAPVREVILNYDINDYKSKTELTSEKLFITIITALRSYDNIRNARAAESASRLKSSFLATMSHEIRTPMNGVLGMLELLSHSGLDADQLEMLGTARDSAGVLLRIIDDILDFSKIEAGRMDIDRLPVNIGALVESVAETVAPNAHGKGLALHVHVDPAMPDLLMGDPVRLRQILFNLTGNAIKFTETGSVSVRARIVPDAPWDSVRVRVEVSDTGIGIPNEMQSKLFQPFTQAERSTSRRFGGTGLGLSICRRLVELMGGEIGLDSRPGCGSTFWFWLDLERGAELPESGADSEPAVAGLRVRLEIPNPVLAGTVADYLGHAGAETVRAGSADVIIRSLPPGSSWPAFGNDGPSVLLAEHEAKPEGMPADVQIVARPVRRLPLLAAVAAAVGSAGTRPCAATPQAPPPPPVPPLTADRLVLVAEDQEINQMVIRRQLTLLGLACDILPDGAAALEAWRTGRYALVLTDCNMPEMDGFELTEAIRREEAETGRRTPVIALTASAMAGEDERCLTAGMDGFLSKPVDLAQLDRCIRRWIAVPAGQEAAEMVG